MNAYATPHVADCGGVLTAGDTTLHRPVRTPTIVAILSQDFCLRAVDKQNSIMMTRLATPTRFRSSLEMQLVVAEVACVCYVFNGLVLVLLVSRSHPDPSPQRHRENWMGLCW